MDIWTLLISLFIVQPVLEYWAHRLTHILQLRYHLDHHHNWSHGKFWLYTGDWYGRVLVGIFVLLGWHIAALMLAKEEVMHTLAHRYPGFRYLHRHHFLHHRNPACNFSFSAVWPDRLFGTLEA